jgi:hypothetical protein
MCQMCESKRNFQKCEARVFCFFPFVLLSSYLRNCPRLNGCLPASFFNSSRCQVATEMSTENCRFLPLPLTVCSYKKLAIFTTNVHAENQCLINHKTVCGALNRQFLVAAVMGWFFSLLPNEV